MTTTSAPAKPVGVKSDRALLFIILLLVGALLFRLSRGQAAPMAGEDAAMSAHEGHGTTSAGPMLTAGDIPPDFTLLDLEGNPVSLSQFQGQPLLLNFWASWCVACKLEMPAMQAAYEAHQKHGLVILAVTVDDTVENARQFRDENAITFPMVMDDEAVSDAYQVHSIPTSFFIGTDGNVAAVHFGPLTEEAIDQYFARLN